MCLGRIRPIESLRCVHRHSHLPTAFPSLTCCSRMLGLVRDKRLAPLRSNIGTRLVLLLAQPERVISLPLLWMEALFIPTEQALPYWLKILCRVLVDKCLHARDHVLQSTIVLLPNPAFQRAKRKNLKLPPLAYNCSIFQRYSTSINLGHVALVLQIF